MDCAKNPESVKWLAQTLVMVLETIPWSIGWRTHDVETDTKHSPSDIVYRITSKRNDEEMDVASVLAQILRKLEAVLFPDQSHGVKMKSTHAMSKLT